MTRRVLLVGASGVFGRRMAARLALWPELELVLAGRRAEPLDALRRELIASGAAARLTVALVDRERPGEIVALAPWAVVDAAGPFQGASLDLAHAVVDAGAHWIDLADARDFVAAFAPRLDDLARRRGVAAVTGASSTPAISGAALDRLSAGWTRLDRALAVISPGRQMPGLSLTRALLSRVGQKTHCFIGGRWVERASWSGLRRLRLPGVGRRWVCLAETPDLDLLPRRAQSEGLFFAGVEPPLLHFLLWLIAWPVRLHLVPSLAPFARILWRAAAPITRFGAPRGGMMVIAEGLGEAGERRVARWSLAAAPGAGPSVPIAPALAVLRAIVAGRLAAPGARPCVGLVSLDQITAELAHLAIETRIEAWRPDSPGLFPRVLGDDFEALPEAVRRAHGGDVARLEGRAVSTARGWAAPVARLIARLPGRGRFDASVEITPRGGGEVWTRRFGPHRFASHLKAVKGEDGLFEERMGPLAFRFSSRCDAAAFRWVQEGWSLGPVPLPLWIGPRVRARSFERDGLYRFTVVVAHPWLGVLVAYAGRLELSPPGRPLRRR